MSKICPKFTGIIRNGKVSLDDPENYDIWLGSINDQRIELVVQKERHERTNQQSKYLWGVIYQAISDELGYTPEEVHDLCKTMFLKTHLDVKEKRYTIIKSTKELNTQQFSEYVEQIKRWASSELSIAIPEASTLEIN